MTQQNHRNSADNEIDDRKMTTGQGKTGGNAGAGKSGGEDLGPEKKSVDERFGSRKASGSGQDEDEGKKDEKG